MVYPSIYEIVIFNFTSHFSEINSNAMFSFTKPKPELRPERDRLAFD